MMFGVLELLRVIQTCAFRVAGTKARAGATEINVLVAGT